MSFDREALARAVAREGRVARVVVASSAGSVPREVGAAMLVWPDGQDGTIGGGQLEFEAVGRARSALVAGDRLDKVPLGPAIGQCCGGAVMLLTEVWDGARLATLGEAAVRALPGFPAEMPLKVRNRLRAARNGGRVLRPEVVAGWMVEPLSRPARQIWVWGAGHVGRAVVGVLAPLPDLSLTWIDTAADRFPQVVPGGVALRVADQPAGLVDEAPAGARHLIMTMSHALDLELCHRLLRHGFGACGLIGSATKWARFRSRLAALGHPADRIARIDCPIGRTEYGKHPQAIAVGVAATLLEEKRRASTGGDEEREGWDQRARSASGT